jgi:hypothetical protein
MGRIRINDRSLRRSWAAVAAGGLILLTAGGTMAASAAGAATTAPTGAATSAPTGTATSAPTGALQVLTDDVLPGLPLLAVSPAPAAKVLHVGVALTSPHASAATAYASAVYNPSSADYHHFLTPSQYASAFGVPAATVQAVTGWLKSGGLAVTQTAAAGNWIQATGTVAQIDSLMNVSIAQYQSKGVTFLANQQAPTVPSGYGISTVVGLNTLQHFSVPKTIIGQPAGTPSTSGCAPSCIYTPQDLWSMYDQPTGNQGQGVTMAVFGEGRTDDVIANLRAFEKAMKLRQVPITVSNVGAGPFTDDSGQLEWDLDTQASTGMAPKAYGETMYFASSLFDADVESAFTAWVNDAKGPLQANASFGECETDPANTVWNAIPPQAGQFVGAGNNLEPVAEATLQQATIEGRTLFSSAGDTGSSCPLAVLPVVGAGNGVVNQGFPFQNYPCISAYAVCVGGTVLYDDGATPPHRNIEYVWPYTGGGSSAYIAEPDFQKGVSAINRPCVVDPSGNPYPSGTICRGAPDVAAMSGDIATNAYSIYANGSATTEGGTSLSSPLWVGMWTRLQAAAPAGGLGFANPVFYAIGTGKKGHYGSDFFDVTTGTNGLYQAGTGWDYVSGWGVPDVTKLMQDVDGRVRPTNPVLPPPVGKTHLPCGILWQNPNHVATDVLGNSDPQLSLLQGTMGLSADGQNLIVKLNVTNLSATVPTGATGADWYATWSYNNTVYFANAQLSPTPGATPTFGDGTVTLTGNTKNYNPVHTNDQGSFTPGANGVVEIDVPLANVGGPAVGAVLSQPAGVTFTEEGAPGVASALETVDSGGPTKDYTLGSVCKTPA